MTTSTMPQWVKDKWIAALRSGDYKQGKDCLQTFENNSFCCLGVLQMVVEGQVERLKNVSRSLPTLKWLEKNNIKFYDNFGVVSNTPNVYAHGFHLGVDGVNDAGISFEEIANLIEAQIEGF